MSAEIPTFYRIEPLRGVPPVLCTHCGGEIAAYGINAGLAGLLSVSGTYSYQWRHVATEDPYCDVMPPKCRPYDDFDAQRALNAAKASATADPDDGDPTCPGCDGHGTRVRRDGLEVPCKECEE